MGSENGRRQVWVCSGYSPAGEGADSRVRLPGADVSFATHEPVPEAQTSLCLPLFFYEMRVLKHLLRAVVEIFTYKHRLVPGMSQAILKCWLLL